MRLFTLAFCLIFPFAAVAQDSASEEADKGYLTNLLQSTLSDAGRAVVIDGFEGALSSRATIERLSIADDEGIWLTVEGVVLDWNRAALLSGRLEVAEFSAERVVMPRGPVSDAPPSPEATPFSIPSLPVSVDIAKLAVARAEFGAPVLGQASTVSLTGEAHLEGGGMDVSLALERQDGVEGEISLIARYAPESGEAAIDLVMQEAAGGIAATALSIPDAPALDVTLKGEGLVSDLTTRLSVASEGAERLGGTIRLTNGDEASPGWAVDLDIAGDVTPLFAPGMRDFFGQDVELTARAAERDDGAYALSGLSLTARTAVIEGDFVVSPEGWPQRMALRAEIADPGKAPVTLPTGDGETQVSSASVVLAFDADEGSEFTLTAETKGFRTTGFVADALTIGAKGTITQGDGAAQGAVQAVVDLAAKGLSSEDEALARAIGEAVSGRFDLAYTEDAPVQITGLALDGADFALTGSAAIDGVSTGLASTLDMVLKAESIARFGPLAGADLTGAAELEITGAITPLSGGFDLEIAGSTTNLAIGQEQVDALLAGDGTLEVSAKRDETGLTVRNVSARTANGVVQASGTVASEATALDLSASVPDFAPLYPGQEASGSARLSGKVTLAGTQLDTAKLTVLLSAPDGGQVRIPSGDLRLDGGTLGLDYTAEGQRWSLSGLLRETALPGYGAEALTLQGEGVLTQAENGIVTALQGEISLTGNGLSADDAGLAQALGEQVTLDATLSYAEGDPLQLNALRVAAGDTVATGALTLALPYGDGNASYDLALKAPTLSQASGLAGLPLSGAADITATGRVNASAGSFEARLGGTLTSLGIGTDVVDTLLAGTATIAAEVARSGPDAPLTIQSARLDAPNLDVTASGTPERITLDARLADLGLIASDFSGPATASGTVTSQGGTIGLDIRASGPGGSVVNVTGGLTGGQADLRITGDAPLGVANSFIAPRRLNGRATLDLTMQGTPGLESLSGTVRTSGARAVDTSFGVALEDITGGVTLSGGRALIDIGARGGEGGRLGVTGSVGLSAPQEADLTVTAQDFKLRDPALYDTSVDGTVTLAGPLSGGALLNGQLSLGASEIRIPSSGMTGLSDIPDITHVGERAGVTSTQQKAGLIATESDGTGGGGSGRIALDLRVSAPNQVYVRGRGLDAELGGRLRLTGTTQNVIPVGAFELVRGRLDILSQRFNLTEGSARMTGSFDAALRLVATTEKNGTTISIIVEGSPSDPEITFTSSPELPEEEVLAQLIFGRDLSTISPLQALELANAVATLAGSGGGGIVANLRQNFGLDDLDVTQTDDGDTAVRAGKYLSKNIYSDVVVESDGTTELNLNLQISPNVTAKGSTSTDGNAGIGIFFERDY
ncbi:translocation/assembly module TamB domain-containing protein [Vannielia sp.]|uniref:translocation/assembly module TamB domain-containing protein n=1 Tax=Vannielia sp. TaxID=2813045 RepID=UPI0026385FC8|nr:translocation/assembly module TamB domain-containing protein [Vannielia sp.]MDF1872864.1 translocation/assembly module TamB domain-containing protein [Vannielia sp.]